MNVVQNKSRKTDRRTLYTKKVIQEAYCTLLRGKNYDRISVTDICKLADINRTTFYLHYMDSKAVFEELLDELIEKILQQIAGNSFCKEDFWRRNEETYHAIMQDPTVAFLLKKGMTYPPFVEKFAACFAELHLADCRGNGSLPESDLRLMLTGLMYSYIMLDLYCLKTRTVSELEHCNALFNHYLFEPCYRSILSGGSGK